MAVMVEFNQFVAAPALPSHPSRSRTERLSTGPAPVATSTGIFQAHLLHMCILRMGIILCTLCISSAISKVLSSTGMVTEIDRAVDQVPSDMKSPSKRKGAWGNCGRASATADLLDRLASSNRTTVFHTGHHASRRRFHLAQYLQQLPTARTPGQMQFCLVKA